MIDRKPFLKHFFLSPCQTLGFQAGNPFNHRVLATEFISFSLEHDTILEDIASTDVVKSVFTAASCAQPHLRRLRSEWPKLRDIIKAKLEKVSRYSNYLYLGILTLAVPEHLILFIDDTAARTTCPLSSDTANYWWPEATSLSSSKIKPASLCQ